MEAIENHGKLLVNCLLDKVSKLAEQLLEFIVTLYFLLDVLETNILGKLFLCFNEFSVDSFLHFLKFAENNCELLVIFYQRFAIVLVFANNLWDYALIRVALIILSDLVREIEGNRRTRFILRLISNEG